MNNGKGDFHSIRGLSFDSFIYFNGHLGFGRSGSNRNANIDSIRAESVSNFLAEINALRIGAHHMGLTIYEY